MTPRWGVRTHPDRARRRERIPSSPPILTKNTFETIGFERVFFVAFAQASRDFFEIFRGFSASLQNPGNACCIRLFGHRKILVRGIFRCFFPFFSCFLSVFCEFLTCFRHFYAVPRTFCAVKFGQLHGFFHRFQRLGFVIPTEVRVNVACCLDVRVT